MLQHGLACKRYSLRQITNLKWVIFLHPSRLYHPTCLFHCNLPHQFMSGAALRVIYNHKLFLTQPPPQQQPIATIISRASSNVPISHIHTPKDRWCMMQLLFHAVIARTAPSKLYFTRSQFRLLWPSPIPTNIPSNHCLVFIPIIIGHVHICDTIRIWYLKD